MPSLVATLLPDDFRHGPCRGARLAFAAKLDSMLRRRKWRREEWEAKRMGTNLRPSDVRGLQAFAKGIQDFWPGTEVELIIR